MTPGGGARSVASDLFVLPEEPRMSAHPAIDVAPHDHPRPGLALVLALLAIPGSTVAWDLPAGGFWIGVPLSIVAIVLGIRARRALPAGARGMGTAAVVIGAILLAFTATWTIASALS